MKRLNLIVFIWGIFDFAAIAWYLGWNLYIGKFPLINDIEKIADTSASFGLPYLSIFSYFAILIYASLILSGVYLVKHNKIGAIVCYIQAPFRLLFIIPPSIFFIGWPLGYFSNKPNIVLGILLVFISEIIKVISVSFWHKQLRTAFYSLRNTSRRY
jgi:hypothetical protein